MGKTTNTLTMTPEQLQAIVNEAVAKAMGQAGTATSNPKTNCTIPGLKFTKELIQVEPTFEVQQTKNGPVGILTFPLNGRVTDKSYEFASSGMFPVKATNAPEVMVNLWVGQKHNLHRQADKSKLTALRKELGVE